MAHWDELTDPISAAEAKGHAIRKSMDTRKFSRRQVAKVYTRPIPVNSADAEALMGAVRDSATQEMKQPNLKDIFKFKVKLMSEAESPYSADDGIPSVSAIPRSFNPAKSARVIALLPTAWSKKGYTGKIPKIDDLVIVECSYSSFDNTVSLENVEFVEIAKSDITPNDLYGGPCKGANVEQRLNALFTGDWTPHPHPSAGHTSNASPANDAGTITQPGVTPDLEKCSEGEFCDRRIAAMFDGGERSQQPTFIVMHATAGSPGAGKAASGARYTAAKPYGPLIHVRCKQSQITNGECIAKTSGGKTVHYLKCNASDPICTAKGDPLFLKQSKVSPHYFVDQGGEVVEACSPDKIGYHAGSWNRISIGIEHTGHPQRHATTMWNDTLLNASAQLTAGLCQRYNIPVRHIKVKDTSLSGLIGHEIISNSRTDPGEAFPWERYMNLVNQYINDNNFATRTPNDIRDGVAANESAPEDDYDTSESLCPPGQVYWEAGENDEESWDAGCYSETG